MPCNRFALKCALGIGIIAGLAGNLPAANIIDATYGAGAGSFELGNFVNGGGGGALGYEGVGPGSTTIVGWTVGGPGDGVDWLTTPNFNAESGAHSIDLQHTVPSSIFTTIPTIAGDSYQLSVWGAATTGGTTDGRITAGNLNASFTVPTSPNGPTQVFHQFIYTFIAQANSTTITLFAVGPATTYGPVIDNVSVDALPSPTPEPTGLALCGLGLAAISIVRRRSYRMRSSLNGGPR